MNYIIQYFCNKTYNLLQSGNVRVLCSPEAISSYHDIFLVGLKQVIIRGGWEIKSLCH